MVKARFAAIVIGCILAAPVWATTPSPALIVTPPQPTWSELTVEQKIVLAPLSDDWDSLEYFRQKKWIGIVARFPSMTQEEQRRIQAQMQQWGKLTPEQRAQARENFKAATQLPAEKKQALKSKWEEYSSLPEDEKEKLKQQAVTRPSPKPGRSSTVAAPPVGPSARPPIETTPPATPSAQEQTLPPSTPQAAEESTSKP